jgi:amidophosphoribosyltransferase
MIPHQPLSSDQYPVQSNDGFAQRPDKPEEACGVFGVYAPGEDVAKLTYFGLYALQHRGQESAGIATFEGERVHLYKDMGLVSQVFNESILNELPGIWQLVIPVTQPRVLAVSPMPSLLLWKLA